MRAITVVVALGALAPGTVAHAEPKRTYANCAALNQVHAHGVGKKGARDKTSGRPVTNFKVSTRLYNILPSKLDRDKDGIKCEKH